MFATGIPRVPAAARILNQGFLSPSLEYLTEIPTAVCLLVCSLVMARIERRGLGDYGLSLRRGASKHLLWGLFWGLCVFSGVIVLIAALHGFSFGGLALHGLVLLKYAGLWTIGFLLVGFVEEFLYRGYVQFTLHGPGWLTGRTVGPEASVISMLALSVAMFCFHFLHPRASRQE